MGPHPHQPLEHQPVGGECVGLQPGVERGGGYRQNLGANEAGTLAGLRGNMLKAAHHPLSLLALLIFGGS